MNRSEEYHVVGKNAAADPSAFIGSAGVDSPSKIRDFEGEGWSEELMLSKTPFPQDGGHNTVLTATADPNAEQALYLWEEGNMPAIAELTGNVGDNNFDAANFRPYVTSMPVRNGIEVKGAVLLCAGGAFQFRADYTEAIPTAEKLNALGFQCFIVDYRIQPYTQQEGALDLARAVRFVRKNADVYGIDPNDIAVMGFSAGGILAGEMLLHYNGLVNGAELDKSYMPDDLDSISADVAADGMIYSFYGKLGVASRDIETLMEGQLPPTYFCYGSEDPYAGEFEANYKCLTEAGVETEKHILPGYPHGYGALGDWIEPYSEWLNAVFSR